MKEKMKEVYEAVTTSGEASLSFEIEGKRIFADSVGKSA